MIRLQRFLLLCFIALPSACGVLDDMENFDLHSLAFEFNYDQQGWTTDFTDFAVSSDPKADSVYRFSSSLSPAPTAITTNALKLSCNNVNSDVFMFLKRKVSGYLPNTTYTVVYEIHLSSNVPPGSGVILKAGASDMEPRKVIEGNYHSLNLDKGANNSSSGEILRSFGDIGVPTQQPAGYSTIVRGNAVSYQPLVAKTNSRGELWLVVGTDASYKGVIDVFYSRINVVMSVSN